jgi:hypothetical protein
MEESEEVAQEADAPADEYAVVELFGHVRRVGRVLEVEKFGTKMLRVDVPKNAKKSGKFEDGFVTMFYGGSAIYGFTPCDLATVERENNGIPVWDRLKYPRLREEDDLSHEF